MLLGNQGVWARRTAQRSLLAQKRRRLTQGVESLEPRRVLAITWDAGGDGTSWSDPLNWSTNQLPSTNDQHQPEQIAEVEFGEFHGVSFGGSHGFSDLALVC